MKDIYNIMSKTILKKKTSSTTKKECHEQIWKKILKLEYMKTDIRADFFIIVILSIRDIRKAIPF